LERQQRRAARLRCPRIEYLKHSIELDPNNAEAWAILASCYTSLGSDLGAADPAKVIPLARNAIAKAFQLDPNLAEAHTTLAWIKLWYDWDWTGAEQEFRRSLELNSNDSAAHREYRTIFSYENDSTKPSQKTSAPSS
jgi:Tfp pilus assembly protein PilF